MNHKAGYSYWGTVLIVLLLSAAGCTVPRIVQHKKLEIPDRFSRNDSTQAQPLQKHLLFPDKELVRLIDSAVKQNPDVLVAAQRLEIAHAHLRYRKGAMLPNVSIEASASAQKYGDYTMEGVGNFDTNLSPNIDNDQKIGQPIVPYYFLGLRSSWEIDLWGKLKRQKEAAYKRILATEEGKRLVVTSLVAAIAGRYYELAALDAVLDVLKYNISLQDSAVHIARIQKQAGRTTELGVQQFQAQLLRTKAHYERTRQQIVSVENEINLLVGRFPQQVQRGHAFRKDTVPEIFLGQVPEQILNRRPDIRQAEHELEANSADVAAARAALLPALVLAPFGGYSSFNSATLFNPASIAYGIVGGLTAPLFNRSDMKANVTKAEADRQIAYQEYFRTVINAFKEVETTLSDIHFLKKMYRLNMEEASVLSDAITTSTELYKAGYASYLEVITAQGNAIEAQINTIETRKNIYLALTGLYRSSGGGW